MAKIKSVEDLKVIQGNKAASNASEGKISIKVAMATCSIASGSKKTLDFIISALERRNIELVGVVDIAPNLIGKQLPEILEIPDCPNLTIEMDLQNLLSNLNPDVVMIATSSSLQNVLKTAKIALEGGANVISLCEELSYPQINYPEITSELNSLAKSKGLTITGTGINPGYLMDLLPIVLTAPCQTINHIK